MPISRGEYVWSKVVGVALSFLAPWMLLLIVALMLILATPIPDGMLVYTTLVMMFALADFCVIVCTAMLVASEAVQAIVQEVYRTPKTVAAAVADMISR